MIKVEVFADTDAAARGTGEIIATATTAASALEQYR